jgi:hypothetical protein
LRRQISSDIPIPGQQIREKDGGEDGRAYVCVSPLGERNHATAQAMATTTKPMMILQLFAMNVSDLLSMIENRKLG